MTTYLRWAMAAAAMAVLAACGDDGPAVSFTAPADGATVAGGVPFELDADGITIEAAGRAEDGAGHFHVVAGGGCVPAGETIPRDADHVHLGDGGSEGLIYLEPGTHELCAQVGDGLHEATDVVDTITVEVAIGDQEQWCAVVGEVDELFLSTDTSGEDFATNQVGYRNIARLLAQLADGIEHVDENARASVTEAIDWATAVTRAFTESADLAEAEEALAPLFTEEAEFDDAEVWVREACGVDIDD